MRFEDEEVKVVALGTAWVAAVTSLNFLRIFTEGGLQVCHVTHRLPFYVRNESMCILVSQDDYCHYHGCINNGNFCESFYRTGALYDGMFLYLLVSEGLKYELF